MTRPTRSTMPCTEHRWRLLFGITMLCVTTLQATEVHHPNTLPDVLRDIPYRTGTCSGDTPYPAYTNTTTDKQAATARQYAPDTRCRIDALAARDLLSAPDTLLVDLRNRDAFDAWHIAGALPMSLPGLRTRDYLRDKTLLLADDGRGQGALYSACAQLKAEGSNRVHVLHGGLAAWQRAGLPLQGNEPAPASLLMLSAAQLFQESTWQSNLLLLAPSAKDMQAHLHQAIVLPALNDKAIAQAIAQQQAASPTLLNAVVIITGTPTLRSNAIRWQKNFEQPILIYDGTPTDYADFLTTQQAVWAAHQRGPRKPPGCRG